MPKDKGKPGGKLVTLSPDEYKKIVEFHQKMYDPSHDPTLTPKQCQMFKQKAKKFIIIDDEREVNGLMDLYYILKHTHSHLFAQK
jgi:hypothetical protein